MDAIKEKLSKDDLSKELLSKIEGYLSNISKPDILITSSRMTNAIISSGIHKLYEDKINFIHTLSCPYCYTSRQDIDKAIYLTQDNNNILLTKENALNIVGSKSSLKKEKDNNSNIIVINRESDAIDIAKNHKDKNIILFSCGFEHETPNLTGLILEAKKENIENLSILLNNKLLPPAVRHFLNKPVKVDGYVAPGDLSIILGSQTWKFVNSDFNLPVAIGGFDNISILYALDSLLCMIVNKESEITNNYSNLVGKVGNTLAQNKTYEVLIPKTVEWKGYGLIPFSGLTFSHEYSSFNALEKFEFPEPEIYDSLCQCEFVVTSKKMPQECTLYKDKCTPSSPCGTCMSCDSGLCYIYYNTDSSLTPDLSSFSQLID